MVCPEFLKGVIFLKDIINDRRHRNSVGADGFVKKRQFREKTIHFTLAFGKNFISYESMKLFSFEVSGKYKSMKKTKCFLWSMVVMSLSATVPLYGDDSDDDGDLDSAPKAKFEEVAPPAGGQKFALPKTFEEIQSEFKGNSVNARVPATNAEEVFEEIKKSFRKQSKNDFRELCQGLWEGVPFLGSPREDTIYKTLAFCLPRGCVFNLQTKIGNLKTRSSARAARLVHFGFYYKNCKFMCEICVYKDDFRIWLRYIAVKSEEVGDMWKLDGPVF